jgi:hypothetical protein
MQKGKVKDLEGYIIGAISKNYAKSWRKDKPKPPLEAPKEKKTDLEKMYDKLFHLSITSRFLFLDRAIERANYRDDYTEEAKRLKTEIAKSKNIEDMKKNVRECFKLSEHLIKIFKDENMI